MPDFWDPPRRGPEPRDSAERCNSPEDQGPRLEESGCREGGPGDKEGLLGPAHDKYRLHLGYHMQHVLEAIVNMVCE